MSDKNGFHKKKIKDAIFPYGTKRRFVAKVLKNIVANPRQMTQVIKISKIKDYYKFLKEDKIEAISSRYDELVGVANEEIQEENKTDAAGNGKGNIPTVDLKNCKKLFFKECTAPLVSIVIPVYNQFGYTYGCLESILENSGDADYEIIIADDCSEDLTTQMEVVVKNVRRITGSTNMGFLRNCNNAAKYARGKYILFLNNDTRVEVDWLNPLLEVMEKDESIGMAGSKLLYPNGLVQEAGGIIWSDGSAANFGHLKKANDQSCEYVKEADYISGASIMIRKQLWEQIGGFDERYSPAYYEDADLAFEVRKAGYKVKLVPKSVVIHYEGISNGTDTGSGTKAYQITNREKFHDKWKKILEMEQLEPGKDEYLAKDRGQLKKQMLVVDAQVPNYDKNAGERCSFMYIKMFLGMGFKVTFIGDSFAHPQPYTSELEAMGVEILYGTEYYGNIKGWLKNNLRFFDYVYLQRPAVSIKYIDYVKKYSHAKIFYFAHDLHYIRMHRAYLISKDRDKLIESNKWKRTEMKLFKAADVGHVVGNYEQQVMEEALPNKIIRNIPLYIYEEFPEGIEKDFSKRKDLIFVGGFAHEPNVDAVKWFYTEVFPKILKRYPDIVWHIVGGKATKEILDYASDNIVFEGFVDDEKLAKLYNQCRLSVVPLRFGAGVKGKVVESSYYQIPLVTTSIGGEGLEASESFIMEDDADKMAELITSLYEDFDRLKEMSDAGRKYIQKYFTLEVAEEIFLQDM